MRLMPAPFDRSMYRACECIFGVLVVFFPISLSSARFFFSASTHSLSLTLCCHTKVVCAPFILCELCLALCRYGLSISFSFFSCGSERKKHTHRNDLVDFYCRAFECSPAHASFDIECCSFCCVSCSSPFASRSKLFVLSPRHTHTHGQTVVYVTAHSIAFSLAIEMKSNFNMDFGQRSSTAIRTCVSCYFFVSFSVVFCHSIYFVN